MEIVFFKWSLELMPFTMARILFLGINLNFLDICSKLHSYSQFCCYYSLKHGYFRFLRFLVINDIILHEPRWYLFNVSLSTISVCKLGGWVLDILRCISVVCVSVLVVVDHIRKVTIITQRFGVVAGAQFIVRILVWIRISSSQVGAYNYSSDKNWEILADRTYSRLAACWTMIAAQSPSSPHWTATWWRAGFVRRKFPANKLLKIRSGGNYQAATSLERLISW